MSILLKLLTDYKSNITDSPILYYLLLSLKYFNGLYHITLLLTHIDIHDVRIKKRWTYSGIPIIQMISNNSNDNNSPIFVIFAIFAIFHLKNYIQKLFRKSLYDFTISLIVNLRVIRSALQQIFFRTTRKLLSIELFDILFIFSETEYLVKPNMMVPESKINKKLVSMV